ncbi:Polyketide cyclase / dehydrase and lipid transport [Nitrosomonas cryotolerans]|uniref:Polyketide cyclase / dehydrase and lipid transport n=1 Tax=Nitrosomonas cryotolerans ATCC 49181 TaxID=1131553 RepID=A0A1N6I2L9_9PROT|nr:SRPBCC family protein [Nitrosomonas cryotolerans]SFP58971.1 Polyketide cyclase / dehydrase and lipid transport [Nitrosomonas cryotolerans]SIO26231.1 Polyketide cyclase / dehydrase and lipid transport [Nitrosomonas cryotolerans ATCC 49181]
MFNLGAILNLGSTEPVIGRASIIVECSSSELFQYLGNDLFQNYPKWSPEVKELEQITPGPVQLGTIGRQVRVDQGRRSESRFKIFDYDKDKRLTLLGVSDPFRCSYELQVIDSGNSTKLTFTFELLELLAIMRPLEGLVRAAIKDGAERTVQNIKRLVEAEKSGSA